MTTDITDPVDTVRGLIDDNWNTGNCSPKPVIRAMKDPSYARLHSYTQDGDGVLIYEMKSVDKPSSIGYSTVDVVTPLALDVGTSTSRAQFMALLNEVRRILHSKRITPGSGWDTLTLTGWNDLSSKTQRFWRRVIECRLERIGEVV